MKQAKEREKLKKVTEKIDLGAVNIFPDRFALDY
jgi:hypothetical protein